MLGMVQAGNLLEITGLSDISGIDEVAASPIPVPKGG